jgi:hypothetical protein
VSGNGTLDTTSGGSVVFTAADTAGAATVTVSAKGCLAADVTYNIIAPSGLLYTALNGIKHTQGLADIGMRASVYLQPDSVSFKGLAYLELDAPVTATGPYLCLNGSGHSPNPNALVATQDDIVGLGTPIATDTVESGSCGGVDQLGNGSISLNIPQMYMVGLIGAQHQFSVVQHIATASTGALNITKGAASRSTTVSSPTSAY